jgi:predicted RNase H-like HicB family nuclease
MKKYPVVLKQDFNDWIAFAPDVPNCLAISASKEEAFVSFCDVLKNHINTLRRRGQPVPIPGSRDYSNDMDHCSVVKYVDVE